MLPSPAPDSCIAFLVRHGATENNVADPPLLQGCGNDLGLSEEGLHQAEQVGELLASLPMSCVYSSPLLRAMQTAEPIARRHGLAVTTIDRLHEVDVGRWEGRSWEEIQRTEPDAYSKFIEDASLFGYPGGENMVQLLERIVSVLEQLMKSHLQQRIAIVGHNVTHRVLVAHLLGIPLKHARRVTHANGGVSVVQYQSGTMRLVTLNSAFHLT